MKFSAFCLSALMVVFFSACSTLPPPTTVSALDLSRYEGTWHEIARYPNCFQRSCKSGTTATYKARNDGKISVVNRCITASGKVEEVSGTAEVVPGSNGAKLKVGFGGPFRGDYWVLGLDEKNYDWAVVGHPSRKFLWLLARSPQVSESALEKMLSIVSEQGFSRERLQFDESVKRPKPPGPK